jgi:type II secretory pathway component GspD/PulD (secretin)
MRTLTALLFAAAFLAATGCGSSGPRPEEPAPAAAEPAAAPAAEARPQEPPAPRSTSEWDQLMEKLKANYEVTQNQKTSQADEHYRLAERYYGAGDFEKAELECEKALKLHTDHAPARALWLEVQFILGRGKATPASEEYDKYMKEAVVRHQQTLVEIDNAFQRGTREYNLGNYDAAEREYRRILEYSKWMPTGVELETRRREALAMLERTKEARRQKLLDEEKAKIRIIEEEKARDEYKRLIDQKRELELLFGQAQMFFEREEYERCAEICERILYVNPNLTSVAEMRNVAQRLNHMARGRDNLRNYVEEWKRTFEMIEEIGRVQADELLFTEREVWIEQISKRKPKGIAQFDEEISPDDQQIVDKLNSIRITIDMQNAPLTTVVEYIREISGLNFVIDTVAIPKPEEEMVTIKVADIVLSGALKLILQPKQKVHTVSGGVVSITSTETLKKRVKLELYDVQDLTYGMMDFPGVDISLSQDAIGTSVAQGDEVRSQFTGEDLADLIKKTIHKDQWEEADGKSVAFSNGLLIVRNAIEVHKAVRKFLSDLRASTGMLVSVECRFLAVEDNFLRQVGMDFRDVDGARVNGITNLADINPPFLLTSGLAPQFVEPTSGGLGPGAQTPGITSQWGQDIQRRMGARVQHIMTNDFLVNRFYNSSLRPLGGGTLQFTLLDDVSLEAVMRLVSRSERSHVLTAPKLTLFNTQRGNVRISNQMAYIRDWDVQIATAAVVLDPVIDVVSDGISLDVRPIVSADRRFVTMELRPTVATLFPAPPNIFFVTTNVTTPGAPITDALPIRIETPIVNIQRIRTTVVCPDRGTLMLGGLSLLFDEDVESSIPIWRSVPIVGNLGSEKVKGLARKTTMCIVRVRIIIPDEEERRRF